MKALVLGSAQDGGLPQFGDTDRDSELAERSASSVVVALPSGSLLLDASPDLRRQDATRAARGFLPVTDVALTHAHMGHYAGLVHFGREAANAQGLRVWMTASMARFLHDNQPWRRLFEANHCVAHVLDDGDTGRLDGHTIRFFPVEHRAEFTDTVAISVDDQLLYLPDIDHWGGFPTAGGVIAAHQTALLDATFFTAGEIPGRTIAEIPHPLVTDTVATFAAQAERVVLTHLNHTNPLCDSFSAETRFVVQNGFRVAFDGMSLGAGSVESSGVS